MPPEKNKPKSTHCILELCTHLPVGIAVRQFVMLSMFSWLRDIIFEVYKKTKNFDFSESIISPCFFFGIWQKFCSWPAYVVIIGFPIQIDSVIGNYRYRSEKSDSWKKQGEILIIFLGNLKNVFIISEMMFLRQESKYNGKNRPESTFCCENPSPNHDFSSKNKQNHWFFMVFLVRTFLQ